MSKAEFCVIGMGRFGTQISTKLNDMGHDVMVVETNEELVRKAGKIHEIVVRCNATDINELVDIGIQNVKTVIVAISEVETSILICANLIQIGVRNIIAKATNQIHERVLKTMGIPKVVVPEIEVANRTAIQCAYNLGSEILNIGGELSWVKIIVTNKDYCEITFDKLGIKDKLNANIIMVERNNKVIFPPTKDTIFKVGDIATIVCHENKLKSIIKLLAKELDE